MGFSIATLLQAHFVPFKCATKLFWWSWSVPMIFMYHECSKYFCHMTVGLVYSWLNTCVDMVLAATTQLHTNIAPNIYPSPRKN